MISKVNLVSSTVDMLHPLHQFLGLFAGANFRGISSPVMNFIKSCPSMVALACYFHGR